ncbi:hypothetical protein lerEdw1_015315 [Lerista edwardsae]|nr:hypothetical protein lerEdw1_015315 [Lerista edwardsae]
MPSNGPVDTTSHASDREAADAHKQGEEEPDESRNKEEKPDPGIPVRKAGRPGRKRKQPVVESGEAPKDTASAPKCPPPSHNTSPMEQVPNGDAEMGSPEKSSTPTLKGRQRNENEPSSLPDGEAGRALENGRCTPKDSSDPPASEGKEEKEENHYNSLKMEASSLHQGGRTLEAELMECK